MQDVPPMPPNHPRITVIVPAHNAAATLDGLLSALARQELDQGFEVVVVDDRSTDSTASIAELRGARLLRSRSRQGPAEARNAGAAATGAELLAFTDADCEPASGWLREGIAALDRGADLVTGPIEPLREPGPFERTLRVEGPSPLFESANLFARRSLFDRLGGFQPPARLTLAPDAGHFGEDAVFGWRAVRSGARTAYAPGALVRHAVFARGARGYVAERRRLRFFPMLVREVPELRSAITARIFLSPRTACFDLAAAGVLSAAVGRRRAPLAVVAPYAWLYLRSGRPWRPSVLRRNAAFVAADLVGLGALIQGSVTHRRLLL